MVITGNLASKTLSQVFNHHLPCRGKSIITSQTAFIQNSIPFPCTDGGREYRVLLHLLKVFQIFANFQDLLNLTSSDRLVMIV